MPQHFTKLFDMKKIFYLALVAIILNGCHFGNDKVDMIIHNAIIYTMDEEGTTEDAMAIKDGIIVAMGPEREIMNQYDAPIIYDAKKRAIYPGFIDGHCHFLAYGLMLQDADLTDTKSFDEVLDKLKSYAPGRLSKWIIGRGWDQNDWGRTDAADKNSMMMEFPSKERLDSLFGNTPVYLSRIDGHAVLVNSIVLEMAGISASTVIPGGIVEVKNGQCTGILIDKAIDLVNKIMPDRTSEEKVKALKLAQDKCFQVGLTTVDEAGLIYKDVQLIDSLQKANVLKMRIYAMLSDDSLNYVHYLDKGIDTSSRMLTVRSFKFYADGALGSRGACLLSPYEDLLKQGKKDYGMLLDKPEYFKQRAQQLNAAGFQMNTHAIGDSANRTILYIYRDVLGGVNDKRWRIEHAQVLAKEDMNMFRENSIIPSVQPTHATSDMPWAWQRLGKVRVGRAYIYKELLEQNGLLALGTDFPVEGISPMATFYSAVVRKDNSGMPEGGFQMENAISRREAMMGMTIWNALSNFEDSYKGSLQVGKVADFVVMDRDVMKCDESQIKESEVVLTVIAGEVVWERK